MRRNKYGNKKTRVDGIVFDSQAEAALYQELRIRMMAKEILRIECHFPFDLWAYSTKTGGCVRLCTHEVDFLCTMSSSMAKKVLEVHEYKGVATALWRLKKKLFEANYPSIPYIVHKAKRKR